MNGWQPGVMAERCTDEDGAGRSCQLLAHHPGLHAADVGDLFLTWQFGEVLRWRKDPPPHWLIELFWLPELQPVAGHDAA